MPDIPSTAVRRALAGELRRLREDAGLSGDEVAAKLNWSGSKVSRIETCRTGVKAADLERLLSIYEVAGLRRDQLKALAEEQDSRSWWVPYAGSLPAAYLSYISLEDSAIGFQAWSPELINGLLQTEDYAMATMGLVSGAEPWTSRNVLQRRVDARLRRQELLRRSDGKRRYTFVLDEATLHHGLGSAATMRAQLDKLVEISKRPGVSVRILAFKSIYPIGPGGFAILHFRPVHNTELDDVVYTEHLTHSSFVETGREVHQYQEAFKRLLGEALDTDESRQLIARVARDTWQ
jgi:transcriptional regulator with XRE-family HTH domain